MADLYKGYIRQHVRRVLAEADIPLERAIDFLKENPKTGVIVLGTKELTLEELQNVKDFRSEDRSRPDNEPSSGREVSEDSDRELFESFIDNTE